MVKKNKKNKKCNRNIFRKRASRLIFYRRLGGKNNKTRQQYQWRNRIHSARFLGSGIVHHRAHYAQLFRILPQAINLKKPAYNDGHFCYWAVRIVVFFDDWCGNSIPKKKNWSATDWLFICLLGLWKKWNFLAMSDAFSWPFVHPDGWHAVDWLFPSLSLIRQPRKKQKQLAIHTAHSSSSHVHTHHDEFRACASALNNNNKKKNLPRLSRIGSFVLYL